MDVAAFVKKDYLLVISALLALISLFFVPFDTVLSYNYGNILKTICILLSFLLIVAALKECKALQHVAQTVLRDTKTTTALCLALIFLPFFCAMLFSNDVALLTFVPFSITVLRMAEMKGLIAVVCILQTVAANVGSYLTPFGNPHNIYIYNLHDFYGFDLWDYELELIPIVAVGTIALLAMVMLIPRKPMTVDLSEEIEIGGPKRLYVILALMALAVVTVLDCVPFYITAVIVVAVFLLMMPTIFRTVDYSILFVFFFLFIFANGMTNIESVNQTLSGLMDQDPMLTTVAVSQFTSNVPSTLLLQPFTDDWAAVLVGADIGGFGTPIASMASIITLKLYMREEDSDLKRYFKLFFLIEGMMLAVLIPTYYVFC